MSKTIYHVTLQDSPFQIEMFNKIHHRNVLGLIEASKDLIAAEINDYEGKIVILEFIQRSNGVIITFNRENVFLIRLQIKLSM